MEDDRLLALHDDIAAALRLVPGGAQQEIEKLARLREEIRRLRDKPSGQAYTDLPGDFS